MAVFTELNRQVITNLLLLHDVEDVVTAEGLQRGTINTTYRVTTKARQYYLRVSEQSGFWDLVHEKDLLLFLASREALPGHVQVPHLVRNVAGGYLFPMDGKFVCLFETVPGRDVGVFEIRTETCRQVGTLLGQLHVVMQGFSGRRRYPFTPTLVKRWIAGVPRDQAGLADARALLREEMRALRTPLGRLTPHGTLHGDPVVDNVKLHNGQVCGVIDFEYAGQGPLLGDVAIALNAWCWDRDHLDMERCAALLQGYNGARPFTVTEKRVLQAHCRFAAACEMAKRIWTYELSHSSQEPLVYRSYASFEQRLHAWRAVKPRALGEFGGACAEAS